MPSNGACGCRAATGAAACVALCLGLVWSRVWGRGRCVGGPRPAFFFFASRTPLFVMSSWWWGARPCYPQWCAPPLGLCGAFSVTAGDHLSRRAARGIVPQPPGFGWPCLATAGVILRGRGRRGAVLAWRQPSFEGRVASPFTTGLSRDPRAGAVCALRGRRARGPSAGGRSGGEGGLPGSIERPPHPPEATRFRMVGGAARGGVWLMLGGQGRREGGYATAPPPQWRGRRPTAKTEDTVATTGPMETGRQGV